MQQLQQTYAAWLDAICQQPMPPDVVAFNVNLYDSSDDGFYEAELIGASTYDRDNEDWACDEVFHSGSDLAARFQIPASMAGSDWEQALRLIVDWTRSYCEDTNNNGRALRQAQAVTAGFVDGNLVPAWPVPADA